MKKVKICPHCEVIIGDNHSARICRMCNKQIDEPEWVYPWGKAMLAAISILITGAFVYFIIQTLKGF